MNAAIAYRRNIAQWWADGWDILVTPTVAGFHSSRSNCQPHLMRPMDVAGVFVPFTPRSAPVVSQPSRYHSIASIRTSDYPIVGAYGRGSAAPTRCVGEVPSRGLSSPTFASACNYLATTRGVDPQTNHITTWTLTSRDITNALCLVALEILVPPWWSPAQHGVHRGADTSRFIGGADHHIVGSPAK